MEIDNLWKAENWNPEELMDLYVKAGAKYFVALANHHDNFDNYDSTHHDWNSVQDRAEEGHRRHLGQDRPPARPALRRHQPLARTPGTGFRRPMATTPKARWPACATTPTPSPRQTARANGGRASTRRSSTPDRNMVMPDGITTIAGGQRLARGQRRQWNEEPSRRTIPKFVENWFLRCQELVDKLQARPALLRRHGTAAGTGWPGHRRALLQRQHEAPQGKLEAVLNAKGLKPDHVGAMSLDIERGKANDIQPVPWQTDTCIGDWHYNRSTLREAQVQDAHRR